MSQQTSSVHPVSRSVVERAAEHLHAFTTAQPFKHVVIEQFFEPEFAARVLADFPSFQADLAKNEIGLTGGKAVNTKIREISPVYQELYDAISSPAFLELVSRISGIPDLILDPKMYGGGTHDNQHGQELDPHVDFNYDESRQLHRRLNLIVYMNPEWEHEWGGALEIHSNPRRPFENRISSYDPLFNRCVMFETNEYSWHGFPKIHLPENKRRLSRKSISIYLYTKDRPAEEIVPEHGTFYVQRFLPAHIISGYTLSDADIAELQRLLIRRDSWIEHYHRVEIEKNGLLARYSQHIAHLTGAVRAPLTGYVRQNGPATGVYSDGWAASRMAIAVSPSLPVSSITVYGWLPGFKPKGIVSVSAAGGPQVKKTVGPEDFEVTLDCKKSLTGEFSLEVEFHGDPANATPPGESRDLAFILKEIRFLHPGVKHP